MKPGDKSYIGDGVYVVLDRGMICLTTENGIETTNTIYLEPEVWRALKAWVERVEQMAAAAKRGETGMSKPAKTISMCSGCRDDFYNDHNPYGVKQCWSFPKATVEKRLMIGVDQRPPYNPKATRWVLSCYHPERVCNVKPEAITKEGYWR